jgi:hypothetical protein
LIDRAEGVDAEEIDRFFRDDRLPERLPGSDRYADELW